MRKSRTSGSEGAEEHKLLGLPDLALAQKGSLADAHRINDEIEDRPPSVSKHTALDDIADIVKRERFGPNEACGWFERL